MVSTAGQSRPEFLFELPLRMPTLGQTLDDKKSNIVPGASVFRAWIAQAHDEIQILHGGGRRGGSTASRSVVKLLLLFGRSWLLLGSRSGLFGAFGWSFFGAFFARFFRALGGRRTFGGWRALRAFFFLFFDHLDLAGGGRSGFGGFCRFFLFGARRGDGNDGNLFISDELNAWGRFELAEVNRFADFKLADIYRNKLRQIFH